MEATKLEIQAKYGTITPEGQERLGVLQAKMNDFWVQRKESSKSQPNLLEIPGLFTRRETLLAQQIQPQLTIGQPGDKYEQEADRVAADVVSQMHQPQSKDISIQAASKLKHQVGVSDKRTASSESGNVVNTVDGIQCKVTQTDGNVIQLLGVGDVIKKFEQIAKDNKVSTDSQPWLSDKRKPIIDRVANKSIKAEEEAQQSESQSESSISNDSQVLDFQHNESKEEAKESEDEILPSTSFASETDLFDINQQVEKNLNKIADYLFSLYKTEKEENPDDFTPKKDFQVFYDDIMRLARKLLTDLLSSKSKDGFTAITPLSDEEIIKLVEEIQSIREKEKSIKKTEDTDLKTFDNKEELEKHLTETKGILEYKNIKKARQKIPALLTGRSYVEKAELAESLNDEEVQLLLQKFLSQHKPDEPKADEPKEQIKPKTTGKERWNKLKKIVKTDPSLPQIKGKSKSLNYHKEIENNYWLEAWDALHRPAFKLAGNNPFADNSYYGNWLTETGMYKWLSDQEARDKAMRADFEQQKQLKGGETNFWEWKAKSKYAGESSPPPTTDSFWDWLDQKGIKIPGVKYLESEVERRSRGVTISGGTWTDAFGDDLSSKGMKALDAPDNGNDWMIFVLSPDGKFYADAHTEGEYHHSSALAGIPIKGAGAIKVINGQLEAIADKSGHYKPNMHQMYTTLTHLEKLGVNPETYMVYTRDLGDMQGNKWIEKYENSDAFKEYREQQQKNVNIMEQRRKREKASREKSI
ncbi:hypothetical protein H6G91_17675 [Nostoc muscorum FACHB-395]|nr:hypothetical protein [Desmonostoc muscorum FACHB-395]